MTFSWVPLYSLATCNDHVLSEATDPDFAFRYVDISAVTQGNISDELEVTTFADSPSRARRLAQRGDIILSTVRTYLRAVATVKEPSEPRIYSTGFAVLRPKSNANSRYLSYRLQSDDFMDEVVVRSVGVSYPAITAHDLMHIRLTVPPLKTQLAIADYLDHETAKIDLLIEKQSVLIERVRERRLATIDVTLERATGTPEVPLGSILSIQAGVTLGKLYGSEEYLREYPYLRVANVKTGYVDIRELSTIKLPKVVADRSRLRHGDVLITEGGDRAALARGSLWQGQVNPCLHQNHIFALRPDHRKLTSDFLVYLLESSVARKYFEKTRRQTTNLSATNSRLVRAFRFCLPAIDDQREIVDYLDRETGKIDTLIAKAERFIELAKERRAALITAAVTGQIDVTTKEAA